MTIILKADGTSEEFEPSKLEHSLRRAGASDELIKSVIDRILVDIGEEETTSSIYTKAFEYLKEGEHVPAARYAMRRALIELGPTGFPFEDYMGELFRALGYTTRVGTMMRGKCVEHEVDLIAEKEGETIAAELKFHNQAGFKTDTKVALYVHARFQDLQQAAASHITRPLLITNTKFTHNAIEYATCVGLDLISWSYPEKGNLQDLIQETKVYPVTVLTTLNQEEKRLLMDSATPLCSTIAKDPELMLRAGIHKNRIDAAFAESKALCAIN